VRAASGDIFL